MAVECFATTAAESMSRATESADKYTEFMDVTSDRMDRSTKTAVRATLAVDARFAPPRLSRRLAHLTRRRVWQWEFAPWRLTPP